MSPSRIIMIALVLLLAVTGGLGAWAYAGRGYPDVVYYERQVTSTAMAPDVAEDIWIDPRRHWILDRSTFGGNRYDMLYRDGLRYALSYPTQPSLYFPSRGRRAEDSALQAGGLAGLAAYWYGAGLGRSVHDTFGEYPALRFAMPGQGMVTRYTVWIDARTHALLGRGYIDGNHQRYVQHIGRWARYAPNTLPADLFDLPESNPSLWDRAMGWARDRAPGSGAGKK